MRDPGVDEGGDEDDGGVKGWRQGCGSGVVKATLTHPQRCFVFVGRSIRRRRPSCAQRSRTTPSSSCSGRAKKSQTSTKLSRSLPLLRCPPDRTFATLFFSVHASRVPLCACLRVPLSYITAAMPGSIWAPCLFPARLPSLACLRPLQCPSPPPCAPSLRWIDLSGSRVNACEALANSRPSHIRIPSGFRSCIALSAPSATEALCGRGATLMDVRDFV